MWLQQGVLLDRVEETSACSNGGLYSYIEDRLTSRDTEARISSGYLQIALVAL